MADPFTFDPTQPDLATTDVDSMIPPVVEPTHHRSYDPGVEAAIQQRDQSNVAQQVAQQQTQRTQLNRLKAEDLAQRGIPFFKDPRGDVNAVTDDTGTPVTGYDKTNDIAWTAAGNPVKVNRGTQSGVPELQDPFQYTPPTTDEKTGDQYQMVPGLPWKWVGRDEGVAQQNLQKTQDVARRGQAAALAGPMADAKTGLREAKKAGVLAQKSMVDPFQGGVPAYDADNNPIDFKSIDPDALRQHIDDSFDSQLNGPAASAKSWFGSGYTPAAQEERNKIEAQRQKAHASADSFLKTRDQVGQYQDALDQMQDQREALSAGRLDVANAKAKAAGLPPVGVPKVVSQQPNAEASAIPGLATSPDQPTAPSNQKLYTLDEQGNVQLPPMGQGQARAVAQLMADRQVPQEQAAPLIQQAQQAEQAFNDARAGKKLYGINEDGTLNFTTGGAPLKALLQARDDGFITPDQAKAMAPEVSKIATQSTVKPEGFVATASREFATKIAPAIGTALGGIGGAAAGTAAAPGPGTIAGDIAGGAAGGTATAALQRRIMGDAWAKQNEAQIEANAKEHPMASMIGSAIPFLVSLIGGGGGAAAKAGSKILGETATQAGEAAIRDAAQAGGKGILERMGNAAALGARGGASEGAQEKYVEGKDVSVLDQAARGAVTFAATGVMPEAKVLGAIGLFPQAKQILADALKRTVADGVTMTFAGDLYDAAVHGKPLSLENTANELGGNMTAFALQNIVMGALHARGAAPQGKTPEGAPGKPPQFSDEGAFRNFMDTAAKSGDAAGAANAWGSVNVGGNPRWFAKWYFDSQKSDNPDIQDLGRYLAGPQNTSYEQFKSDQRGARSAGTGPGPQGATSGDNSVRSREQRAASTSGSGEATPAGAQPGLDNGRGGNATAASAIPGLAASPNAGGESGAQTVGAELPGSTGSLGSDQAGTPPGRGLEKSNVGSGLAETAPNNLTRAAATALRFAAPAAALASQPANSQQAAPSPEIPGVPAIQRALMAGQISHADATQQLQALGVTDPNDVTRAIGPAPQSPAPANPSEAPNSSAIKPSLITRRRGRDEEFRLMQESLGLLNGENTPEAQQRLAEINARLEEIRARQAELDQRKARVLGRVAPEPDLTPAPHEQNTTPEPAGEAPQTEAAAGGTPEARPQEPAPSEVPARRVAEPSAIPGLATAPLEEMPKEVRRMVREYEAEPAQEVSAIPGLAVPPDSNAMAKAHGVVYKGVSPNGKIAVFQNPQTKKLAKVPVGATPEERTAALRKIATPQESAIPGLATSAESPVESKQRVRLNSGPQTYTIEEKLPQTAIEKANGEQAYRVRNERTGEVSVVQQEDMRPVGGVTLHANIPSDAASVADRIAQIEALQPIRIDAQPVTYAEAEAAYKALGSGETSDGRTVAFVNSIFGKLAGHRGRGLIFRAIPQFKEILKEAVPAYSEEERNPKPGSIIQAFHNYVGKIELGNSPHYVRFTVQELRDDRNQLHNAFISDAEIMKAGGMRPSKISDLATETSTGFDQKLHQWLTSVNRNEPGSRANKPLDEQLGKEQGKLREQAQSQPENRGTSRPDAPGEAESGRGGLAETSQRERSEDRAAVEDVFDAHREAVDRLGIEITPTDEPVGGGFSVSHATAQISINPAEVREASELIERAGGDGRAWANYSAPQEEIIHHLDIVASGHQFNEIHQAIWDALSPEARAALQRTYISTKSPVALAAEYLRMLQQRRLGDKLTEAHYSNTSDIEEFLDAAQPAAVERQLKAINKVDAMSQEGRPEPSPSAEPNLGVNSVKDTLGWIKEAEVAAMDGLDTQQQEVLRRLSAGEDTAKIAKALGIEEAKAREITTGIAQKVRDEIKATVDSVTESIKQFEATIKPTPEGKIAEIVDGIRQQLSTAKAVAKGFHEGFKSGAEAHAFVDRQRLAIKDALVKAANEALPKSEQGQFLKRITDAFSRPVTLRPDNEKQINTMYGRAATLASEIHMRGVEVYKKGLVGEIKKIAARVMASPSVDVEYKRAIKERIANLSFTKPTARTVARLTGTKEYIENQNSNLEPNQVPEAVVQNLDRLSKLNAMELPTTVLQSMLKDMTILEKIGRLKVKARNAVREIQIAAAVDDIQKAVTHPIESRAAIKAQPTEKLVFIHRVKNAIATAQNRAEKLGVALNPMAAVADMMGEAKGTYDGALERNITGPVDTAYNTEGVEKETLLAPIMAIQKRKKLTEQDWEHFAVYATLQQKGGEERLKAQGVEDRIIDKVKNEPQPQWLAEAYSAWEGIEKSLAPRVQQTARNEFNLDVKLEDHYFPMMRDHDAFRPESTPEIDPKTGKKIEYDPMSMTRDILDDMNMMPRKNTEAGFTKERVEGAATPIRLDGLHIIRRHVQDALHYIHMQPVLNRIAKVAGSDTFRQKYGDEGQAIWRDWIDTVARQGGVDASKKIRALDMLRKHSSMAMVAFRLSSQFKHASNVPFGIYHAGGAGYYIRGMMALFDPKAREWAREHMHGIFEREGGEPAIHELEIGKASEFGFWIARRVDFINAYATAIGAYINRLAKDGLDPEKWMEHPVDRDRANYAMRRMNRAVASVAYKDMPQVVTRGRGLGDNVSLARAVFQFGQVFLDQWSNIGHDFFTAGAKRFFHGGNENDPHARSDGAKKTAMMGAVIAAVILTETGIVEGMKKFWNTVTGNEPKHEEDFAHTLTVDTLKRFPFVGQLSQAAMWGRTGIPMVDMAIQPLSQGYKAVVNKTPEARAKAAVRAAQGVGGVLGIPASGQIGDIINKLIPNHKSDRQKLVEAVREGKREEVNKAVREHKITRTQANQIFREARMTPEQVKQSRMKLEELKKLAAKSTTADRQRLNSIIARKEQHAQGRTAFSFD